MSLELKYVGKANASSLDRESNLVAEALARIHGQVTVTQEKHGLHFYMASPIALQHDGVVELTKRHLAVNIDKYLGRGSYATLPKGKRDWCANCMKYSTGYRVTDLLRMQPLERRGIAPSDIKQGVKLQRKEQWLFTDAQGMQVPLVPQGLIPINALPEEHHAVQFLRSRLYDPELLYQQFGACYCTQEIPEDFDMDPPRAYRRLPGGWKITSQGRILFFAYMQGQYRGWQARIPQLDQDGYRYYWHPYRNEWEACEFLDPATNKWQPLVHLVDPNRKWEMLRYWNGPGTSRSDVLLGFDAAYQARHRFGPVPTCILGEGPLDAARFGPPAMPLLGKFLGAGQAQTIARYFRRVIYVRDNDVAGLAAAASVNEMLAGHAQVHSIAIQNWSGFDGRPAKDAGDLHPINAMQFLEQHGFHAAF
jgi:hypothetical protein